MITSPKLDVGLLGREEEGGKKLRGKGVGSLSPPARSCLAFHNSHSIPRKNGWFSSFKKNRSLFTLFTVTDNRSINHVGLRFRLIKRDCLKKCILLTVLSYQTMECIESFGRSKWRVVDRGLFFVFVLFVFKRERKTQICTGWEMLEESVRCSLQSSFQLNLITYNTTG